MQLAASDVYAHAARRGCRWRLRMTPTAAAAFATYARETKLIAGTFRTFLKIPVLGKGPRSSCYQESSRICALNRNLTYQKVILFGDFKYPEICEHFTKID